MPRVKKTDDAQNDVSSYKNLGTMSWKQALKDAYSPGVDTVAVSPEMFRKQGMKRLIVRKSKGDKVTVIYDREYVFYRMHSLFITKLDIINDGKFDDELYSLLMTGLKEYVLTSFDRETEAKLLEAATALDKQFPGMGVEHWYGVLKTQQAVKQDEQPRNNDETRVSDFQTTSGMAKQASDTDEQTTIDYETWGMNDDDERAIEDQACDESELGEISEVETIGNDGITNEIEDQQNQRIDDEIRISSIKDNENAPTEGMDVTLDPLPKRRGRPKKAQ